MAAIPKPAQGPSVLAPGQPLIAVMPRGALIVAFGLTTGATAKGIQPIILLQSCILILFFM